ncbi:hypothetical protein GCM10018790_01550 [Kitasatospora xanthocidica]|uniref:hypothetical protein n=1 Tax=Kitasatospora xanthocidica TaxID=83382 RepID=UPI0016776B0A|nr:hypothetical protein [Kitasatospora xanthocidica]GHF27864.1 hypothetical protein GCM10018790_01550 [Kitasatospora xanthocidica]
MPDFNRLTLAIVDDTADRGNASDGHSRYDAYIARHVDDFHEDGAPLRPVDFAIAAWRTATAPVMAPGYVTVRRDIQPLDVYRDHHGGAQFCAKVGLRHAALTRRPGGRPLDWERDPWFHPSEQWPVLVSPDRTDRPAVLVTATVLLPIPDGILLAPTTARPGRTLTEEARTVVAALAEHANRHLTPLVNDLLGDAS